MYCYLFYLSVFLENFSVFIIMFFAANLGIRLTVTALNKIFTEFSPFCWELFGLNRVNLGLLRRLFLYFLRIIQSCLMKCCAVLGITLVVTTLKNIFVQSVPFCWGPFCGILWPIWGIILQICSIIFMKFCTNVLGTTLTIITLKNVSYLGPSAGGSFWEYFFGPINGYVPPFLKNLEILYSCC